MPPLSCVTRLRVSLASLVGNGIQKHKLKQPPHPTTPTRSAPDGGGVQVVQEAGEAVVVAVRGATRTRAAPSPLSTLEMQKRATGKLRLSGESLSGGGGWGAAEGGSGSSEERSDEVPRSDGGEEGKREDGVGVVPHGRAPKLNDKWCTLRCIRNPTPRTNPCNTPQASAS